MTIVWVIGGVTLLGMLVLGSMACALLFGVWTEPAANAGLGILDDAPYDDLDVVDADDAYASRR